MCKDDQERHGSGGVGALGHSDTDGWRVVRGDGSSVDVLGNGRNHTVQQLKHTAKNCHEGGGGGSWRGPCLGSGISNKEGAESSRQPAAALAATPG